MEKERGLELRMIRHPANFYAEFELTEKGAVFCEKDKAYHLGNRIFLLMGDYYIEYEKK